MKKIFFVLIFLISLISNSQKIVENKIDDFTKKSVIRTDWEKFTFSDYGSYIRLNKIDGNYLLNLKIIILKVYSIDENDLVSFLFEDGTILDLKNLKYTITSYGGGAIGISGSQALGFNLSFILSESELSIFKTKKLDKIRINGNDGFIEDRVKEKNKQVIMKLFNLI